MNYFSGGPLDGLVADTPVLLANHIDDLKDYQMTKGFRYTPTSRFPCREWQYIGNFSEEVRQQLRYTDEDERITDMADVEYSDLEKRRREAKISRQALAAHTGLTASAVWRIERNPDSKRTTDEERKLFEQGLAELAAQKGTEAEAKKEAAVEEDAAPTPAEAEAAEAPVVAQDEPQAEAPVVAESDPNAPDAPAF